MNIIQPITKRTKGIFYGWWILASFNALSFYANGTLYYGFTAFFIPIAKDLGWSRAAVSAGTSLFRLEGGGLVAPLVGYLFDRIGARRLMTIGSIIVGLGFLWLSQTHELWQFYVGFTILAVGFSFNFSTVMVPVLTNWFQRKRGLAFGIQAAGNATGGLLVPLWPLLIMQYGWRTTLILIGVLAWVYCIPLTMVVRQRPQDMGLRPDGDMSDGDAPDASPAPAVKKTERQVPHRVVAERNLTVGQVARMPHFWIFAIAMTFWAMIINAITVHMIPYLTDLGFTTTTAALSVTALTLTSIISRIGFGRLADSFDSRYLLAACFLSMAGGLAVLTFVRGPQLIPLFVLAFFPAYGGAIPVRSQQLADYYGSKAFPMLQGLLLMVTTIGSTLGPIFAGWIFDVTGRYTIAWVTMICLSLLAIPLVIIARPPRRSPPAPLATGLAPAT